MKKLDLKKIKGAFNGGLSLNDYDAFRKYDELKTEFYEASGKSGNKPKGLARVAALKKQSVVYVFVTFRSMEGLEAINEAYEYYTLRRRCCYTACQCCFREQYRKLKMRYIGNKWPVL